MKKLLVLAIAAILVLGLATVTMAEATFSGEIDTGFKTTAPNTDYFPGAKATSEDYAFGNMKLSGKLGDDLTGVLVFKADPASGSLATDEADVTFTEDFGSLKFGYFGWNNNLKDILDSYRCDVKSQFVSSGSFKASDNVTVGVAFAYINTDDKGKNENSNSHRYGVDLGYATDTFGVDAIFTNSGVNSITIGNTKIIADDAYTTTGIQGWYKLDAFKLFAQYVSEDSQVIKDFSKGAEDVAPVTEIIGFTYEPEAPFYARFEYDLSKQDKIWGDDCKNEMGIRLGYKLADGAKVEFQQYNDYIGTTYTQCKLICVF